MRLTDRIGEAEACLRNAKIIVMDKDLEIEESELSSGRAFTFMDEGKNAALRKLDTIMYLSESLRKDILSI
jgi:hypothetical protein